MFLGLGLIHPLSHQTVARFGWAFVVLATLGIGVGIYRLASKSGTSAEVGNRETALRAPGDSSTPGPLDRAPDAAPTTDELIHHLRSIDWFQFEQLVALVYRKQGYAVTRRGGANPDGGIDLVLEKDGTRTAVQCKHWKTWNVGVKAVREFLGALTDAGISHGLFVTLGGYTGEAKQLADKHGIEVINETGLARMLDASDARFDPAALEILSDTRKLCPKCEREMVLRTAGNGRGAGSQFWGCSGYPRCRFTMPAYEVAGPPNISVRRGRETKEPFTRCAG